MNLAFMTQTFLSLINSLVGLNKSTIIYSGTNLYNIAFPQPECKYCSMFMFLRCAICFLID